MDRLRLKAAVAMFGSGGVLLLVGVTAQFGWTWSAMVAGAALVTAGLMVEVGD